MTGNLSTTPEAQRQTTPERHGTAGWGRLFDGRRIPLVVALITLAGIWGYWFISAHIKYHGDLTGHINVGRYFLDSSPEQFTPRVQIQKHAGFDGQFFLYLACDPFLRHPSTIKRLDAPPLRARRIAYPLLVWALARQRASAAPRFMFWVCSVASAVTTGLLAGQLRRRGGPPVLALLFPVSYIVIMCFHWLTSESLALALVAVSMFLLQGGRPGLSLLLAMVASLTKEVTLLWPLAVVIHSLIGKDWRRGGMFCLAPAPLVFWMIYLHLGCHLGGRVNDDAKNLSWPFVGAWHRLGELVQGRARGRNVYPLADMLMTFLILAAPLAGAIRLARDRSPEAIALMLAALLSVSIPREETFWDWNNYTRQSFLLGLFLFFVAARDWPRKGAVAALAAVSSLAGVAYLVQYLL